MKKYDLDLSQEFRDMSPAERQQHVLGQLAITTEALNAEPSPKLQEKLQGQIEQWQAMLLPEIQ